MSIPMRRAAICLLALQLGCSPRVPQSRSVNTHVTREPFGSADGKAVELFTMRNSRGMEVRVMTYGATIVSLKAPDSKGVSGDVVLGFDSLAGYLKDSPYFGAVVGRYGNRIAKGRFTLAGIEYHLATNNGPNHLHGGLRGFDKVIWQAEPFEDQRGAGLVLSHTSPDGDEGYPGTLQAKVTYTLTDRNEISIDYQATTDRATPVNLTQHSYFNLSGSATILDHVLQIPADSFTPVDSTLIPTGKLGSVEGTPFDFRTPSRIGARIDQSDQQLLYGRGYDHNFELTRADTGLALAARLVDSASGRTLEIRTTEPGIQFYSGNFLDGTLTGKGGTVYQHRGGLCLETQHFPDSPNQPGFPSTIVEPGQTYHSRTVWIFGSLAKR